MDLAYQLLWKTKAIGEVSDLSCHELMHTLNQGCYALVSGGASHEQLRAALNTAGYRITPATGNYAGSVEPMFMVHEPNARDMVLLGSRYKQHSVVVGLGGWHRMIVTSGPNAGDSRDGKGWSIATGNEGNFTQIETSDGERVRFRLDF